ncbi:MAG: tetratricopeptide repeat protein [Pseudomonadota bacterium]
MKIVNTLLTLLLSLVLGACASPLQLSKAGAQALFNDALFSASSDTINAVEVLALSAEMREFITLDIAAQLQSKGAQQALFDALYGNGKLKLEYDASETKNAAQAFAARTGNCMSLVLMTAAFAKEIGLEVQFQNVRLKPNWSRNGALLFNAGHVNIILLEKHTPKSFFSGVRRQMTVDFLPPEDVRHLDTEIISEKTTIAMYMNNRAAESLAQNQLDNAYWWARAAIMQDIFFLSSYNTLGAIYRAHGDLPLAQSAFAFALAQDPKESSVMLNLSYTLRALGRVEEADILVKKAEKERPYQAYHFFALGQQAMKEENFLAAKEFFSKEVRNAPENPEFHFWLAQALLQLGELSSAEQAMSQAIKYSINPKDTKMYLIKLDEIKAAKQK